MTDDDGAFRSDDRRACRGYSTEIFYPVAGNRSSVDMRYALSICERCVFMVVCEEFAIRHDEHGVWGGTARSERLKKARRLGIGTKRFDVDTGEWVENRVRNDLQRVQESESRVLQGVHLPAPEVVSADTAEVGTEER